MLAGGALVLCSVAAAAGCGGSGSVKGADALVFVSTRDGAYELYASKRDGSDQHRLTKDRGNAATRAGLDYQIDPAWSPDGRRIAFASSRDGQLRIFVVDAGGKTTTRVTTEAGEDTHPTWSPDGSRIAFTHGLPNEIEIIGADGSGLHRLSHGTAEESDPAWSHDGRWLAYVRRTPGTSIKELWLVHPDGTGAHQLTSLGAASTHPTWSPDDKRIAFVSDARGRRLAIYSIGASGIGLRLVSGSTAQDIDPAWSPDGRVIAFSRDGAIVVAPVGKGSERTLTDPKNNDSSPAWKPIEKR